MEGEPLGPREEVASDKDAATDVTIITPRPAVVIDAIEFDATGEMRLCNFQICWQDGNMQKKVGALKKKGQGDWMLQLKSL